MAKDDYHVIVYQILSYLYVQLKKGKPVDAEQISFDNRYFQINEKYWRYIMKNLSYDGLITGITVTEKRYAGEDEIMLRISDLQNCEITPRGIEFLTDHSFMEKAKQFFRESRDTIAPFVLANINS